MARTASRGPRIAAVLVLLLGLALAPVLRSAPPSAQGHDAFSAAMTLHPDQAKVTINRNIYGHFAEHLGRLVYNGIWVGEDSPIPNTRGIRNDVIAALKALNVPVVRWPGGCFADEYHWRDGIGPRHERPRRINTHWGGVIETNQFGTHEFMDFVELIGAEPYVSANVGTGTPREMMEWIEYLTSDSHSALADLRRRNGRDKPWKVPYVGVGNESWGCGGNMRPEYYADEFRRYSTFVKNYSGNVVRKVASGANADDYAWTEVLLSRAARAMQGYSLHFYTLPTGDWKQKGSATQFDEDRWQSTLAQTLRMEELIRRHGAVMDKYDPDTRVGLVVDEWGTWYDAEPGTNPAFLYQQNSLRDAVAAGINLNIFNQHADRVQMANLAQTINVLQAIILTDNDRMILTPTYHVFDMYKVHQGASLVPLELTAPAYRFVDTELPALHASASRDGRGTLHVSLVNLDPHRDAQLTITIPGTSAGTVAGRVLTAPAMNSVNSFEDPFVVTPADLTSIQRIGDRVIVTLPSKSVTVLAIS